MIQINELRIGNIIDAYQIPKEPILSKVTGISFITNHDEYNLVTYQMIENNPEETGIQTMIKNIYPIRLTEEWLLKFGFEKEFNNSNGKWQFFISKDGSNVIIEKFNEQWIFIWELNFVGRPIGFVHELQNIYFALTGKELTYIKTL